MLIAEALREREERREKGGADFDRAYLSLAGTFLRGFRVPGDLRVSGFSNLQHWAVTI